MKINAVVQIDLNTVRDEIENAGYDIIENIEQAVDYILSDDAQSGLMYSEKENIRMFFESDKFKDIPSKDFHEFLKKY